MNLEEKTLGKKYVYKGKIINMRVDEAFLPDGKTACREVVEHNGGVCVAALTKENEIYLVKQFRYPYGEVIYELPAGKRDGDEEPLNCGICELREETGMTAERFIPLGQLYPSPGYCAETIWMYAAIGLSQGKANLDEDEFLESEKLPVEKVVEMIMSGEIKDAKTQAAVLKLAELIRQGKIQKVVL